MAILSADGKSVTVQKGDTLSEIARDYGNGLSYTQLASMNGIEDPDKIYIGQVIKIKSAVAGVTKTNPYVITITHFGLQSNVDNTLFATWTWNRKNTEHYETEWYYDSGDKVWFVGNQSTTTNKQSTYSIPSNAKQVKFRVKPIGKKLTLKDKETTAWTSGWSEWKVFNVAGTIVNTPEVPTVESDKYTITATLSNVNATTLNAAGLEFQVVKKGSNSVYKKGNVKLQSGNNAIVTWSCTVAAGYEYAVRCRAYKGGDPNGRTASLVKYSEWTNYSSFVASAPAAPNRITTLYAQSKTSIYIGWTRVNNADHYEVQYTTDKRNFDFTPDALQSKTTDGNVNSYELTGLDGTGAEYFFRVRAIGESNDEDDKSAWTAIKSIVMGSDPAAPTTWSSTSTAVVGEDVILYWIHNTEDGSSQKYAQIEMTIYDSSESELGVKLDPIFVDNSNASDEDKDNTLSHVINTDSYKEGVVIKWRIRTAGITKITDITDETGYGDWSTERVITVYAKPELYLTITDIDDNDASVLKSFPMFVDAITEPATQTPLSYYVAIIAEEAYQSTDEIGNVVIVNVGDVLYSKNFDIKDPLTLKIDAGMVNLDNGIEYSLICKATMDSGLVAEASKRFTTTWSDTGYIPNAEITFDNDTLAAHIHPYCESYVIKLYEAIYNRSGSGFYEITDTIVDMESGYPVESIETDIFGNTVANKVYTETGEQVYYGTTTSGEDLYYCAVEEAVPCEVTLAVYRREYDGSFTEIATNLDNVSNVFVTDPHPSLDYARYRIVSTSIESGAIGFTDLTGLPVNEPSVIIQWDEDWVEFDHEPDEIPEKPPWAGSMIKIPYNIDVTDTTAPDVSLVEYIGRRNPVSYYGTQMGESATWNVEIPKSDKETIYALRRLSNWMGDVYVREPSGVGYWANITVSFSLKHCTVTVPVTFNITRVEGGI
mgnify:CR=1 FL=1